MAEADVSDAVRGALETLLPGWIETATEHRLLAGCATEEELERRVRDAWEAGALQHDAGMWWMPVSATGRAAATAGAALRANPRVDDVIGRMRKLCDEGRPDLALELSATTTGELVLEGAGDAALEVALAEIAVAVVFALIDAGRLHAAEPIARSAHLESVRRDSPQGQGWFAAALGVTELTAGHILHARRWLTEAQLLGRQLADDELDTVATGALALTFTMVGAAVPPTASPAFASVPDPARRASLVADNAVRGAAWMSAGGSRLRFLEAAARAAKESGEHGRAATLAGELALLGDPVKACTIFDGIGPLDGDLFPLWPRIATALAARDSAELSAIATTLEGLGIMGLSSALTLQAAATEETRDPDAMLALLRDANRRAVGVQLGEQFLAQFRQLLPLREREREIAERATHGRTNKQIAEELVISVRTVENHLYRVYAKLGIDGRDELVALFSATAS
jgi:DNA-binding CsgD family transcriptional regulator